VSRKVGEGAFGKIQGLMKEKSKLRGKALRKKCL